MNVEVKERDSKIMPRLQYKRKDDLAYQRTGWQESVQRRVSQEGIWEVKLKPHQVRFGMWGYYINMKFSDTRDIPGA